MDYYKKYKKYKEKYISLKKNISMLGGNLKNIKFVSNKKLKEKYNLKNIKFVSNKKLKEKYSLYNCNNCKQLIMYHVTYKEAAESILKEGFDLKYTKRGAFGKGINLTTDFKHLKHYFNEETNYVVVSLVKFNKKLKNTSGPEMLDKYTTKPKYDFPLEGIDALYAKEDHEIYVIPNSEQVYPLYIGEIIN
jgi:hypothetical protein